MGICMDLDIEMGRNIEMKPECNVKILLNDNNSCEDLS